MSDKCSILDALVAFLLTHPNVWHDGRVFAERFGYAGWRTRISEARTQRQMDIRNRVRTVRTGDRTKLYRVTEYMFVPRAPRTLLEIAEAAVQEATC